MRESRYSLHFGYVHMYYTFITEYRTFRLGAIHP